MLFSAGEKESDLHLFFGTYLVHLGELRLINKNMLVSTLIIFSIFITLKYHYRYNENRKFHELGNVNLYQYQQKNYENLSGLN